jgi:hypothetical protein
MLVFGKEQPLHVHSPDGRPICEVKTSTLQRVAGRRRPLDLPTTARRSCEHEDIRVPRGNGEAQGLVRSARQQPEGRDLTFACDGDIEREGTSGSNIIPVFTDVAGIHRRPLRPQVLPQPWVTR